MMQRTDSMSPAKYVGIWQDPKAVEDPWIHEIFDGVLSHSIVDGKREVVEDGSIVVDYYVSSWKDSYYSRFRGRNAFLVDTTDEFYDFDPEIYANFRGVIRLYWSDVFRPERVRILPLGYWGVKGNGPDEVQPATARQYVWSFLGQVNKSSRPEMAHGLAHVEPHLLFATDELPGVVMWNRGPSGARQYARAEYIEILRDSIFAPCPMGNVNMECYRVYEALECGAIPVLEKRFRFDYFRNLWGDHPVPTFSSWKEASRWISHMLDRPEEIDVLQRRCTKWWSNYKKSYSVSLGEFLAERSATDTVATVDDIVLPKFRRPGWQARELLRHHNAGALRRRVTRQAARMMKDRRFRVATTAGSMDSQRG